MDDCLSRCVIDFSGRPELVWKVNLGLKKIGDKINLHFGTLIPFSDFEKMGNLIEITQYIRNKTYSLDPLPVYNI